MTRPPLVRLVRLALVLALLWGLAGLSGGCNSGESRDAGPAIKDMPGPPDATDSKVKKH